VFHEPCLQGNSSRKQDPAVANFYSAAEYRSRGALWPSFALARITKPNWFSQHDQPTTLHTLPGYLIFDHGSSFNAEMIDAIKCFGIQPKRTSFRSPWQNGVAERWVGNCRRDLLDHVIVLNERHLKRLMHEYISYYHEDRTHLALAKETPAGREAATDSDLDSRVTSVPRLGGLHHRYDLAA
jgi:hypothetical protein